MALKTKETIGDYADFIDFSSFPAYWRKKSWVPNWVWRLFAERYFEVVKGNP